MKQLTCEMCGGTDLLKDGGVFVCQTCGCKYSIEEAKRMMIEGTVEVAGTVKVDNTDKIANYLLMANNAYEASNAHEAELYCNKIIEVDTNNYQAWLLKGKAAGWQSSIANIRIEETINCFAKAIENAPEDEIEDVKKEATDEFERLSVALLRLCCNHYSEYTSEDNADSIIDTAEKIQFYKLLFLEKSGISPTDFEKTLATVIRNVAFDTYFDNIRIDWRNQFHPSSEDARSYCIDISKVIDLTEYSIDLYSDGDENDKTRYKDIISYLKDLESVHYYYHGDNGYSEVIYNAPIKRKEFIDQMMEYHKKIKEIDPNYEIPERPTPTVVSSGGCYVATAIYGSYDCPQVWTLRRYRDYTLSETWYGRAFIRTYYATSPTLVKWFGHTDWFKNMWRGRLDRMVSNLQNKGIESTPYEDREW